MYGLSAVAVRGAAYQKVVSRCFAPVFQCGVFQKLYTATPAAKQRVAEDIDNDMREYSRGSVFADCCCACMQACKYVCEREPLAPLLRKHGKTQVPGILCK